MDVTIKYDKALSKEDMETNEPKQNKQAEKPIRDLNRFLSSIRIFLTILIQIKNWRF